jgi:hypothetical protein
MNIESEDDNMENKTNYKYLERVMNDNIDKDTSFIESVWNDKYEKVCSFMDDVLDYTWDVINGLNHTYVVFIDNGLYCGIKDSTTRYRIENGKAYLKFDSIDEAEKWLLKFEAYKRYTPTTL